MSQIEVGDFVLIPQHSVLYKKNETALYANSIIQEPTYAIFYGHHELDYGKVIINDLVWYVHIDSIFKGDRYVSPVNRSV